MKRYTIPRIARACGLSRSTLLYYDRIGLLRPSGRTASGYRYYTDADRNRFEGLSTQWLWYCYQHDHGTAGQYEYQLEQLRQELGERDQRIQELERQNAQPKAQFEALHRRQFKGRRTPPTESANDAAKTGKQPKKRGAPVGHPPWQRHKPKRIDRVVAVPAPTSCSRCHRHDLQSVQELFEHVQEDIVLEPRAVAVCYVHQQSYCPQCDANVVRPGPGELLGSYIGPAAKATAIYMRYELNVSDRKISRFFDEFFGLKFVPASAYGFERQAVRRGLPLYEDLRQKIRALPVAHGDETSWRHDGDNYFVWYAGNPQLAFFALSPDRSGQTAQSIFGDHFSGILVSDAYAGYHAIHPKDWQSCLFHIKKHAKELEEELALLKGKAADPLARRFCQDIQGFVLCPPHLSGAPPSRTGTVAGQSGPPPGTATVRATAPALSSAAGPPQNRELPAAPPGQGAPAPVHLFPAPPGTSHQLSGRAECPAGGVDAPCGPLHPLPQGAGKS